jgi:uncharacterized protein (DUF4213/DUF364 family)
VVGHFPFVETLRPRVKELYVLDNRPRPGDLHGDAAQDILPHAQVVAITGMAFVNGTLERLLRPCSPGAYIVLAGPSTPLSPRLFEMGIRQLCGAVVTDIDPVVAAVQAGAGFHDVHREGVRLVSLGAALPHRSSGAETSGRR